MGIWGDFDKNRPSKKLNDFLSGKTSLEDVDKNILTWAEHQVYIAACEIIDLPSKEQRRLALQKIPDTIRPFVEREVIKRWKK